MPEDFVEKIRKRGHDDLVAMLDKVSRNEEIEGWSPGAAFEHIIVRAFELEGAAVKYPFIVTQPFREQIDGAIYCDGLACLIEAKDRATPVNIEPLAKLQNQLSRRPPGTLGIVFARNGFTRDASIQAGLMNPLRILLWEFGDLEYALQESAMRGMLARKYRYAVEHALPDMKRLQAVNRKGERS